MTIKSALTNSGRGLRAALANAYHGFGSSLVFLFVFLAVGAAILAIVESTGQKVPGGGLGYYKLLCLGLAAILAELLGLKNLIVSWWKAKPVSMAAWAGIWAVGFMFSLYGAFYAAGSSQQQRDGIQKAAHIRDSNAEEQLISARTEKARIEKRLGWMNTAVNGKPVRSIESAQADIDNAKRQRLWEATDGCAEIKGKSTKAFCDAYTALQSEKALAAEKLTLEADLKGAKADIARYEGIVATGGTTATTDMTPFVWATSYVGIDRKTAALLEPMQAALTTMLLVSFAGLVIGLHMTEGMPRTRWFNGRGLVALARKMWDGKDIAPVHNTWVKHDSGFHEVRRELQARGVLPAA